MRSRRACFSPALLLTALGCLAWLSAGAPAAPPQDQQATGQSVAASSDVITAETNMVLVDVVVTDKKDHYIRDLEANDFRVFEDDKEQTISSFSRVADAPSTAGVAQPRYVVLFFDNSTMDPQEQMRAREAAAQFVEKNAASDRMMAVVDFGGTLRIAQNFTADGEALKKAVGGVKYASLQPNEVGQSRELVSMGSPTQLQVRSDFAARSVLMAIRNMAKTLRAVPGRKTMIFFSGGFPLTAQRESELTATIDSANKANVAIYTVDVRGLQALPPTSMPGFENPTAPGMPPGASLLPNESPFPHEVALLASLRAVLGPPQRLEQRPQGGGGSAGGGGTGGGGTSPRGGGGTSGSGGSGGGTPSTGGGSTAGGRTGGGLPSTGGGRTGTPTTGGRTSNINNPATSNNPFGPNRPGYDTFPNRSIIPPMIEGTSANQQVLYALAAGTGGFTIFNTNDFTEKLGRIVQELDEYYILGYISLNRAHDGSSHRIKVRVERKGTEVRSRSGYYDTKSQDMLKDKPEGKVLEEQAASSRPSDFAVSLSAPHFYTAADVARVNLTLAVPASVLGFEKVKGKFHYEINILGIAYDDHNSVAARFSDAVKLDLEKKEQKEFSKGSYTYRNNFSIAPGNYTLKLVLAGGGQKFGKYEKPLSIAPYSGNEFRVSSLALSSQMQPVSNLTAGLDEALLEERTPLVTRGMEIIPSSNNQFDRADKVGLYVEVYEPLMAQPNPPRVGVIFNLIDAKTNQQVFTSNTVLVNEFAEQGNPVIPVGLLLPVEKLKLPAGDYRVELMARDDRGNVSSQQTAVFALN
jgi:VWFA-related protein